MGKIVGKQPTLKITGTTEYISTAQFNELRDIVKDVLQIVQTILDMTQTQNERIEGILGLNQLMMLNILKISKGME